MNQKIKITGVIFIVIIVLGAIFPTSNKDYNITAYTIVTEHILPYYLKAPSSAKFISIWSTDFRDKVYISHSNNVYRVNSYFDSQNGFGAMIRGYYDCYITITPVADEKVSYNLLHLKIWDSSDYDVNF